MDEDEIGLEEFLPAIEQIAKKAASNYPDIDWEDIRQHLCLFLLEYGQNTTVTGNGGSVRDLLRKEAVGYCKRERAKGLHLSSQYSYQPSEIKKMLESGKITVPEDSISMLKGMDESDIRADIQESVRRISDSARFSLFRRYTLGIIPENNSYERKRLNAAVNELTAAMNSYRGKRPRKVISNAAAAAIIADSY